MDARNRTQTPFGADRYQRRFGVPALILIQLTLYGGALAAGLIAGALSHSAVIGASVAGIVAVAVATLLRAGS
jgi:hypothetical protein